MNRFFISICLFWTTAIITLSAQDNNLRKTIGSIINNKKVTVGVALIYDGTDTLTINNQYSYPTMSVYKFHQALAVLNNLNKRSISLDEQLYIPLSSLHPNTHSPLRDAKPEGNFYMSIGELLQYSVSQSDNNACDILFDFLGSAEHVEYYVKSLGVESIAIAATEDKMHQSFENQYLNWTTPYSAVRLLEMFLQKDLFGSEYKSFLKGLMIGTITGNDKIKGLLPAKTVVGHKTGSSFRNRDGLKAADNDLGFIELPNGKNLSIAVFIANSLEDDKTNATIIAQISKAAYEYYKNK